MTATPAASATSTTPDDYRKHLEFIQGVITRMSSISALIKGWTLTLSIAAFGFGIEEQSVSVLAIGTLAVALFACLDAGHLREERSYRALFADAVSQNLPMYDMDARPYKARTSPLHSTNCSWIHVMTSWSIAGFYAPIIVVGFGLGWLTTQHP